MDYNKKKIIRDRNDAKKLARVLPDGKTMACLGGETIPFYNTVQIVEMIKPLDIHHKIVLTAVVNALNNECPVECSSAIFYFGEVSVGEIDNEYTLLTQHIDYEITDLLLSSYEMDTVLREMPPKLLDRVPSRAALDEFKRTRNCELLHYRLADNILQEYVENALSCEPLLSDFVGQQLDILY